MATKAGMDVFGYASDDSCLWHRGECVPSIQANEPINNLLVRLRKKRDLHDAPTNCRAKLPDLGQYAVQERAVLNPPGGGKKPPECTPD